MLSTLRQDLHLAGKAVPISYLGNVRVVNIFFLFKTKGNESQQMDVCIAENVKLTHVKLENCISV